MGRALGSEIRGARLGFRYLPDVDGYVRVAVLDGYLIRVDVAPAGGVPSSGAGKNHVVWWEGDAATQADIADRLVRLLAGPSVRSCRVKRLVSFTVDNHFNPAPEGASNAA